MIAFLALETLTALVLLGSGLVFSIRKLRGKQKHVIVLGGIGILLSSGIFLALSGMIVFSTAWSWNSDTTLPSVVSPSGKYSVQVTSFNPSALDAFQTSVELRSPQGSTSQIFHSEDAPQDLRLKWAGDTRLTISRPIYAKAAGQPDYGELKVTCGPGEFGITVICDTYSVIPPTQ